MLKNLHVTCAALSFAGFFLRGLWRFRDSPMMDSQWVRIVPHVVDTVLLGSALAMLLRASVLPWQHDWLVAKLIALLVYIGLGMVAFRFARRPSVRLGAWIAAMLTFAYIVSVAVSKSPLGLFTFF